MRVYAINIGHNALLCIIDNADRWKEFYYEAILQNIASNYVIALEICDDRFHNILYVLYLHIYVEGYFIICADIYY